MPASDREHAALASADRQPLWKRLGWLALIWAASVLALSLVGWLLRIWLAP
jgi:hypothetical protein